MLKDRRITINIENGDDGKTNVLPQVETANISDFQIMETVSLERVLPDN